MVKEEENTMQRAREAEEESNKKHKNLAWWKGDREPSQGRCRTPEPWEKRFSVTPGLQGPHHRSDDHAMVHTFPDTNVFHESEAK